MSGKSSRSAGVTRDRELPWDRLSGVRQLGRQLGREKRAIHVSCLDRSRSRTDSARAVRWCSSGGDTSKTTELREGRSRRHHGRRRGASARLESNLIDSGAPVRWHPRAGHRGARPRWSSLADAYAPPRDRLLEANDEARRVALLAVSRTCVVSDYSLGLPFVWPQRRDLFGSLAAAIRISFSLWGMHNERAFISPALRPLAHTMKMNPSCSS